MVAGAAIFLAYAVVYFFSTLSGSGFEIGVSTLNGITPADLDALNQRLVDAINDDGRIYLTQTRVDGNLAIRFQVGQTDTTEKDVMMAHEVICEIAGGLEV